MLEISEEEIQNYFTQAEALKFEGLMCDLISQSVKVKKNCRFFIDYISSYNHNQTCFGIVGSLANDDPPETVRFRLL